MTEAFEKSLRRCRIAHVWAGVLNLLISGGILLCIGLVNLCKQLIPLRLEDPDLSAADRELIVHNQGLLDWCIWVLQGSLVVFVLLAFLAFHVRWCLKAGRYFHYCQGASWVQSLNAPVGTPAGAMALTLLWSSEGRAHFGKGGGAQEKVSGEDDDGGAVL